MRRELLLLEEMIDAAEQAHLLAAGQTRESLASDRQRGDALLWNFTLLGEAAQLPDDLKADHPGLLTGDEVASVGLIVVAEVGA